MMPFPHQPTKKLAISKKKQHHVQEREMLFALDSNTGTQVNEKEIRSFNSLMGKH